MATAATIEVKDRNPVLALQAFFKKLLQDQEVGAVLVPRHLSAKGSVMPALVTEPGELDMADPLAPSFPLNSAKLVAKLTRGQTGTGMVVAILRPCEVRAFVELVKLNQGSLDNVLLVGVDCHGAFGNVDYQIFVAQNQGTDALGTTLAFIEGTRTQDSSSWNGLQLSKACRACEHPSAHSADLSIGLFGLDPDQGLLALSNTPRGEGLLNRLNLPDAKDVKKREESLKKIIAGREAFRDRMFADTTQATDSLEKLADYLSNCVNCYNCRVACPVCYCKECVFLTNVFDHRPWQYLGWAKRKGALKMPTDTVFFHLTRLAHMSAACVGCGQCSNACPNQVPVMELFRTVAADVQKAFEYQAGRNATEAPPLTVFTEKEFAEVTGGAH